MQYEEFEQRILHICGDYYPGIFLSVGNLLLHTRAIVYGNTITQTNHSMAVSIVLFLYFYHTVLLENDGSGFEVALKYSCLYFLLYHFNANLISLYPLLNMQSKLFSTLLETYWSGLDAGQFSPLTNQGRSRFLSLLRGLNEDLFFSSSCQKSVLSTAFVATLLVGGVELFNVLSVNLGVMSQAVLLYFMGKMIDQARRVSVDYISDHEQPFYTFL